MGEFADNVTRSDHPAHAAGKWDVGATFDGDTMELVTDGLDVAAVRNPLQPDPSIWRPHFDRFGLDPDEWEIAGNVRFNVWDQVIATATVQQMVQFKAEFRPRAFRHFDETRVLELLRNARKRKRRELPERPDPSDAWRLACVGDTQIGKGGPDGLKETLDRLYDRRDMVVDRIAESRKRGITKLGVPSLGDLVEGVCGHYANQLATVSGGWRHQLNETIDVLESMIVTWAEKVDELVVVAVPGNHGEAVRGESGKAVTALSDNFDLFVWEQVRRVTRANPDAFGHVSYVVPEDGLTASYDFGGTLVAAGHGHQMKSGRGTTKDAKVYNWWSDQAFNLRPGLRDAHLMLTGHWHWFFHRRPGVRGHIGIPAMDCGSDWFADLSGLEAPPGLVTLEVGGGDWGRVEVL